MFVLLSLLLLQSLITDQFLPWLSSLLVVIHVFHLRPHWLGLLSWLLPCQVVVIIERIRHLESKQLTVLTLRLLLRRWLCFLGWPAHHSSLLGELISCLRLCLCRLSLDCFLWHRWRGLILVEALPCFTCESLGKAACWVLLQHLLNKFILFGQHMRLVHSQYLLLLMR